MHSYDRGTSLSAKQSNWGLILKVRRVDTHNKREQYQVTQAEQSRDAG